MLAVDDATGVIVADGLVEGGGWEESFGAGDAGFDAAGYDDCYVDAGQLRFSIQDYHRFEGSYEPERC